MGLPHLREADRERVKVGNRTAAVSASIINLCVKLGIPCAVENPRTSILWSSRYFSWALRSTRAQEFNVDMCAFGTRWRKATRVVAWNCIRRPQLADCRCSGKHGVCSFTQKPHIRLTGASDSGVLWTRRAQVYPNRFARCFGDLLRESAEDLAWRNCTRVAWGVG